MPRPAAGVIVVVVCVVQLVCARVLPHVHCMPLFIRGGGAPASCQHVVVVQLWRTRLR